MKRFYFFLALMLLLAPNSCVTSPPLLMDTSRQPDKVDDKTWEAYGAVYEFDEFRIHTELLNPDQGWNTYFYVNRMIRILNRKGVDYGTVRIWPCTDNLVDFKVRLWDPAGKPVPLDLKAMRQKYLETEEVIVPKVEPGCRIGINIVFRKHNLAYSWEHWFERKIPVLKGRFSIFHPGEIQYVSKAYGGVSSVKKQRYGAYYGYIWNHGNILPVDDVFENRWHIEREPHVMARIRHWSWNQFHYYAPDWNGLARKNKAYFMSPSLLSSKSAVKKIASGIIQNKKDAFEKADTLLAYVQDKITLDQNKPFNLNAVNLTQVLREMSGDRWDIAVLLQELAQAAGFTTHVYLTQPQDYGGFDPDFPTWQYLYVPLVAVEIKGRQLVAWPYDRFMGLGEYPFGYHDLQGLSLATGNILPVPASIHKTATRTSLTRLSTVDWDDAHEWQFIYGGHYASRIRAEMSERTPENRKAYFKSLIRSYDRGNSLDKADLETINRQGEIAVSLECRNAGSRTEGQNESHYALRPWFRKYFVDYDNSRKANYTNDMVLVFKDGVLIKGSHGHGQSHHFECANLDNALFSTLCEEKQTDAGLLLSRQLTVKQADLTPEQMHAIQPDIVRLNRIDESYLVEKR